MSFIADLSKQLALSEVNIIQVKSFSEKVFKVKKQNKVSQMKAQECKVT